MAMHADAALSGGGASTFGTGPPPLALYDLIGQKGSPVSYAYSCDMSVVGEEAEDEDKEEAQEEGNNTHNTSEPPPPPQRHPSPPAHGSDDAHEQQPHIDTPTRPSADLTRYTQPPPPPPPPPTDYSRPPISQHQTFPQPSPKRPTDWQRIRYMTVPGRAHKAQLEAWVSGWSESVGELGEETYCACADSTATTTESSSTLPLTREASRADVDNKQKGGLQQQPQHEEQKEIETGRKTGVSFTCRNCARQPSPAIIPDQELVFPPASGAGRVAMKCKLVWKRIVGRTVLRGGGKSLTPDQGRKGQGHPADADTPNISQTAGGGGYDVDDGADDDEDADDEEVDIDKLSLSSKGRRAGDDIADRQARLRRAQRLLRKERRNGTREAG
ncbi:hypothetical protein GE09DRAFT_1213172 [Coniochaeta sp. 2T2.1]|nr:hypothetical protein GE09DRAFT_1213172 [Coniochaeta sp. 2T2.1]